APAPRHCGDDAETAVGETAAVAACGSLASAWPAEAAASRRLARARSLRCLENIRANGGERGTSAAHAPLASAPAALRRLGGAGRAPAPATAVMPRNRALPGALERPELSPTSLVGLAHDLHDEGGVRRAPARRARPSRRRLTDRAEVDRRVGGAAARLP